TDSEDLIALNSSSSSFNIFMNKWSCSIDRNELSCQRCLPSCELQKTVKRIFFCDIV
ncbi:unnamed protein product, partial [Rotaria sordida]